MPCSLCSATFRSREHLKTHLVMHHEVNRFEELVPKSLQEACYAECQMCKRWILHTPASLEDHLRKQHHGQATSMRSYFARFIHSNSSTMRPTMATLLIGSGCVLEEGKRSRLKVTVRRIEQLDKVAVELVRQERSRIGGSRRFARQKALSLRGAPISTKVEDECRYPCPSCDKEFTSWRKFQEHPKGKAGCREGGRGKAWKDIVTRKVAHVCRVCMDLLPCDMYLINCHVSHSHKISLSAYRELPPTKKALTQKEIEAVIWRPFSRHEHTQQLEVFLEATEKSRVFADRCIFACQKCREQFKSSYQLKMHILHPKSLCKGASYAGKDMIDILVKAVSLKCKICNRLVLCDKFKFSEHVQRYHNVTMKTYNTFMTGRNDHNLQSALEQQQKKQRDAAEAQRALREKIPCVPSQLFVGKQAAPQDIPRDKTTHLVDNLCLFRCPKCLKTHTSYTSFGPHLKRCTGSEKFDHTKVLEARVHICALCAKRILCDVRVISCHLRRSHKMSLASYKEESLDTGEVRNGTRKAASFGLEKLLEERARIRAQVPRVVPALKKMTVPPSELPREMTTAWVEDLCLFRCSVCLSFETEKLLSMKNHKRKCMGNKYGGFNPDDVLEAR